MTCVRCNLNQSDTNTHCQNCGTKLALQEQLTDFEKKVLRSHVYAELKRTESAVAGFGCLTSFFGLALLLGTWTAIAITYIALTEPSPSVLQGVPLLFGFLFWGCFAPFAFRALKKRWQRRKHYAAVLASNLETFPPRAPGLSEEQYRKEMDRLGAIERQLTAERLASGEIETLPLRPLPEEIRAQHVWIPGLPGYGKSTLVHWMALQDIEQGKGLTIIDPAGDLVGNGLPDDPDRHVPGIIDWIPHSRIGDTIYLDLKQPVPIDFFDYADEDEKQTAASNLVDLFTRLSEMFGGQPGVRFGGIVRDIIYTLFEAKERGCPTSFIDIYDFIKDLDRRKHILGCVSQKTRAQWDKFPNDEKTEPIISRLTPIARNPRLRTIFGTPNASLKISDVMGEKSILLVNIGGATEAGIILGTIIISQLLQAALRRAEMAKSRRVPHHVYVDEFHNFQVGTDMAKILTQCRKYNLCLTIANQYTAQLPASTLSAAFGGTSTWFLFRMSPQDIPFFTRSLPSVAYTGVYQKRHPDEDLPSWAPDFMKNKDAKTYDALVDLKPLPFDPHILATLQVGEAVHRQADGSAHKVRTYPLGNRPVASFANLIRKRTIEQYAGPPRECEVSDLQSNRDEHVPPLPFPINEGETRGPRGPR